MITIDARWIHTSGMGTYLSNLLPGVISAFPEQEFCLLGNKPILSSYVWSHGANICVVETGAAMYSVAEQMELKRKIPKITSLFWSTHYNIPVLYQGKMLVTVHDMFHLAMPQFVGGLHKRLYAKGLFSVLRHRASAILTVSQFTKDELVRLTGPATQLIYPIHLGVAEDWFTIPACESPHHKPYLLFVGNVKPHKNLVTLVDAFALLQHQIPHDLVIVGKKEGFITGDHMVAVSAERLGSRVCFTGHLSDTALKQYVAHASALVFPSLYEGFGLPPLEAMAAGCPVLASNAASMPEVCGDAAVYFDPRDVHDIAVKILNTLSNPAALEALRLRGLEVAKSFSWDTTVKRTCDVIKRLI